MSHPSENELKQEIRRSKKSLSAAKKLLEEELYEDALSRSYYSILHAAKAALLADNISVNIHERLAVECAEIGRMLGSMLNNPSPFILKTD